MVEEGSCSLATCLWHLPPDLPVARESMTLAFIPLLWGWCLGGEGRGSPTCLMPHRACALYDWCLLFHRVKALERRQAGEEVERRQAGEEGKPGHEKEQRGRGAERIGGRGGQQSLRQQQVRQQLQPQPQPAPTSLPLSDPASASCHNHVGLKAAVAAAAGSGADACAGEGSGGVHELRWKAWAVASNSTQVCVCGGGRRGGCGVCE